VHRANMAKLHDGKIVKREDGKTLKPEGWTPPDNRRGHREAMPWHPIADGLGAHQPYRV